MTSNYAGGRQASVLCRQVDAGLKAYCYQGIGTILGTLKPDTAGPAGGLRRRHARALPRRMFAGRRGTGYDLESLFSPVWSGRTQAMATTTERQLHGPVGLADHGLNPGGRVHWNPTTALLYTHALDARRGKAGRGRARSSSTPAGSPAARRRTSSSSQEPGSEERIWWGTVNQPLPEDRFERAAGQGRRAPRRRGRALRRRRLRRRRPGAPDRRQGRHRPRLPRAVREDDVHRAVGRGAGDVPAAGARPARTRGRGRPRDGRHAHRHVRRAASDADGDPDRRHLLRRGDQERDLHGDERPAAARGRPPDALLGQRRRRRTRGGLLRPLRAPARRRCRPIPSGT